MKLKSILSKTLVWVCLISASGLFLGSCVANKPTKNTVNQQANGKATQLQGAFWLQTAVKINIQAPTKRVWQVVSDGTQFLNWNSTLVSFEGTVAEKEKVTLVSTADTTRTFTIKVKELSPNKRMVWVDGPSGIFHGVRIYSLEPQKDGSTDFLMTEVLAGYAVAFAKKKLPDFRPSFETIAADLKRESELGE